MPTSQSLQFYVKGMVIVMKLIDIAVIIFSYFLGCINTGYYYVRLFYKQDVRSVGTNVTGALNVSRVSGKRGFIITFLGDALKGALVVVVSYLLHCNNIVTMAAILMVLLGHILPIQLKFRGGKGLSTALGAYLAFYPLAVIYWFLTFLIILLFVKRYTVSCLFALTLLPLELFILGYQASMVLFYLLFTIVIVFAGRNNIKEYILDRAYQGKDKKTRQ